MPRRCAGERTPLSNRRFAATPRAPSVRRHQSRCLRDLEIVCALRKRRAESSPAGPRSAAITGALWRSDTLRATTSGSSRQARCSCWRHGTRNRRWLSRRSSSVRLRAGGDRNPGGQRGTSPAGPQAGVRVVVTGDLQVRTNGNCRMHRHRRPSVKITHIFAHDRRPLPSFHHRATPRRARTGEVGGCGRYTTFYFASDGIDSALR
jgi:hypothetical protein